MSSGKSFSEGVVPEPRILGGAEYLCAVAREDPKAFCALLGKLIPVKVAATRRVHWCSG